MKRTSLNLDETLYDKFSRVAAAQRRSTSQALNLLLEQAVSAFEEMNGRLEELGNADLHNATVAEEAGAKKIAEAVNNLKKVSYKKKK